MPAFSGKPRCPQHKTEDRQQGTARQSTGGACGKRKENIGHQLCCTAINVPDAVVRTTKWRPRYALATRSLLSAVPPMFQESKNTLLTIRTSEIVFSRGEKKRRRLRFSPGRACAVNRPRPHPRRIATIHGHVAHPLRPHPFRASVDRRSPEAEAVPDPQGARGGKRQRREGQEQRQSTASSDAEGEQGWAPSLTDPGRTSSCGIMLCDRSGSPCRGWNGERDTRRVL